MTSWDALERELDQWAAEGRRAALWWRDDDAAVSSDALVQILTLADSFDVALGLATIPARLDGTLKKLIAHHRRVVILQHGYAHENHARPGDRKIELGVQRPFMHTLADLAVGWQRLESQMGPRAIPVLVPPWNRIAPGLVPLLPEVGFTGISLFGPRSRPDPVDGLTQVNVHVDIIDWQRGHTFIGLGGALSQIVTHLEARREGRVDASEPTGLMTHHAVHDADSWRFLKDLLTRTRRHSGATWLSALDVFSSAARTDSRLDGRLGA